LSDPDRQSALRVLRRRWRWLVIGVVGGLLLDLLVTAALPRRYEAMTTFVLPESLPVGIDIEEVGTHFTSETLR